MHSVRIKPFRIVLTCLAAFLAGCATSHVPALTAANSAYGQSEDEKKLLSQAKNFNEELNRKGLLQETPALLAYVDNIGRPLIPPKASGIVNFQFHILRSPIVNAFALPDGNIYLSVGLLARLENEAELAQVLGHEIGHVVLRHSLNKYQTNRSQIVAAHIADLFLFGTSIAYLPYIASVASFSREQEEEADQFGIRAIAASGYSLTQGIRIFDLIQEVKKPEAIEGSWYSSHPSNKERADALTKLAQSGTLVSPQPGKTGSEPYKKFTLQLMEENIRLKLNARQYELAADAAKRGLTAQPTSSLFYYYQGEAYRYMAEDPKGAAREHAWIYGKTFNDGLVADFEKRKQEFSDAAEQAYRQALGRDSTLAVAERGLGLVYLRTGKPQAAREKLTAYLTQKADITDRQYINHLLGEIEK